MKSKINYYYFFIIIIIIIIIYNISYFFLLILGWNMTYTEKRKKMTAVVARYFIIKIR